MSLGYGCSSESLRSIYPQKMRHNRRCHLPNLQGVYITGQTVWFMDLPSIYPRKRIPKLQKRVSGRKFFSPALSVLAQALLIEASKRLHAARDKIGSNVHRLLRMRICLPSPFVIFSVAHLKKNTNRFLWMYCERWNWKFVFYLSFSCKADQRQRKALGTSPISYPTHRI